MNFAIVHALDESFILHAYVWVKRELNNDMAKCDAVYNATVQIHKLFSLSLLLLSVF